MARFTRTPAGRATISVGAMLVVVLSIIGYKSLKSSPKSAMAANPPASPTTKPATVNGGMLLSNTGPGKVDPKPADQPKLVDQPKPLDQPGQTPAPKPVIASGAVADLITAADAKIKTGDLPGARKSLNDVLVAGSVSDADADSLKHKIADINQVLVFSDRRFPNDPLGGIYQVKPGDRLTKIAAAYQIPYGALLPMNRLKDGKDLKAGQPLKVLKGPVCAVVNKSKFTLDLYLGSSGGPDSTYLTTFPVGLGLENSTPTGSWVIRESVKNPSYNSPPGHGNLHFDGGDPRNPIGTRWLSLMGTDGDAVGKLSYGIHGTIEPDSIGKMSSQGCIRLRNEDVEKVYDLLLPHKSTVIVKD